MQKHPLFQQNIALLNEFHTFEKKIIELSHIMQIALKDYQIDHIAVRVNQLEKAELWLEQLLKCGEVMSDNVVNGRPIYIIKLNEPLIIANQKVNIIELPFPKGKTYPVENWEHIEIVVPFAENETTQQWCERIQTILLWHQNNKLKVKISEPKVEGEQLPNPSIAVSLVNSKENHTCIKVHPYTLEKIIE
ncbi:MULTISPECIES: VOC family protein [Pasteurellaceae]|uniref:VOC family protein n=1 Tax=Pasteurella atlantica TaxID=2827233 RepID=A0AAW8CP93_9PAST|nr:VOC family protein [Pasteurella atlantica]MBR0573920.1 VOC family protein [Pasteurella atlantica]MDP8039845.1 VOC family protein [Pasteurella atlantica]MDP8041995.1 VOC family protein [Pasteurella atlantica]MDP8044144.1 VOC family protein [Pasteurella atlantica]MDP8046194.1 VOC family protein [Pasteurella atlantica]